MKKLPLYFWLLTAVFSLRLFLIFLFPPTADEAYYLLWAKHLSLNYVDHPPMIAFLNFVFTLLPVDPLIASRFGGALLGLGIAWVIYKISNSWLAALLFWLTPYAFIMGIVLTVEAPLILFYLLTVYFLIDWLKNKKQINLIWAGVFTGLGLISKYSMILIFPVIFAFACLPSAKKFRNIYHLKLFLMYAGISFAIFLPVLLSSLFSGGESFLFHLSRVNDWRGLSGLGQYISEQILYFSPVLIIALMVSLRFKNKFSNSTLFLFLSGLVPFVFFGVLSLKTMVWPHWPVMTYAPFLILLVWQWEKSQKNSRHWLASLIVFSGVLLGVLLWSDPAILRHQTDYLKNKMILENFLKLHSVSPIKQIYTDQHGSAGQLSYYLNTTVLMPTNLLAVDDSVWGKKQFARWNQPLHKGDHAIFYLTPGSKIQKNLKRYFEQVEVLPLSPLAVIELHLKDKLFFLAKGFKLDNQKI